MTLKLREVIQREPPKMNNKRRFIIEEIRMYLNKRNIDERLNRKNRQMEYPNGLTDLRMEN